VGPVACLKQEKDGYEYTMKILTSVDIGLHPRAQLNVESVITKAIS